MGATKTLAWNREQQFEETCTDVSRNDQRIKSKVTRTIMTPKFIYKNNIY